MPVSCYQILDYRCDGQDIFIETCSLEPEATNIERVLRLVSPSATFIGKQSAQTARYRIGEGEEGTVRELLERLQQPRVMTMIDSCSLALCLDFRFRLRIGRRSTQLGEWVNHAKYGGKSDQLVNLREEASKYAASNPALRLADRIAIMPSSEARRGPGPLLLEVGEGVGAALGKPFTPLRRIRSTANPQKRIARLSGLDPDANQRDTMEADHVEGGCSRPPQGRRERGHGADAGQELQGRHG